MTDLKRMSGNCRTLSDILRKNNAIPINSAVRRHLAQQEAAKWGGLGVDEMIAKLPTSEMLSISRNRGIFNGSTDCFEVVQRGDGGVHADVRSSSSLHIRTE